jgi:phage baseplate assembly protein W
MPYASAHEYSEIYEQQEDVYQAELQAARDAILSYAPRVNMAQGSSTITVDDAVLIKQRTETFQAQLIMVKSMIGDLDGKYKKFLAARPE